MDDTWFTRDLPVLDAVVALVDQDFLRGFPTINEVSAQTGLDKLDVARAAVALDGSFVRLQRLMTGGDPGPWRFEEVYPNARLAVGQWPTPESVVDRIVTGLATAAEEEPDPDRRGKIAQAAALLGGSVRDLAVDVTAAVIAKHAGA